MSDASSDPTPAATSQSTTLLKTCTTQIEIVFDPSTLDRLKPLEQRDIATAQAYFEQTILGGLAADWLDLLSSGLPTEVEVNVGSEMPTQAQMQAVMDAAMVAFNTRGFAVRLERPTGATALTCYQLVWENGRWVWKSCDDVVAVLPSPPNTQVSPVPDSLSADPNNPARAMLRCSVIFDPLQP